MAKRKTSSVKKKSAFSHRDFVMYVLVFALVGAFTIWVSFAAPHKSKGGLSLVMVNDANSNGLPDFGDKITFTVTGSTTGEPWVSVNCYQNGTLVEQGYVGVFSGSLQTHLTLGPTQAWQSGSANCTASAYDYTSRGTPGHVYATLNFQVGA